MPESVEHVNSKTAFFHGFLRVLKIIFVLVFFGMQIWEREGKRVQGNMNYEAELMLMIKWPES